MDIAMYIINDSVNFMLFQRYFAYNVLLFLLWNMKEVRGDLSIRYLSNLGGGFI